jgi:hypothetical protein
MNREGHDAVRFFVGEEVEHTPAFGMRTLFVVGIQDTAEIHANALAYKCDHIYFGANQSFPSDGTANWKSWEHMIGMMLRSGLGSTHRYMCTLDLDVARAEELLDGPLVEYHNFIPMLSVKLPYIRQFPYGTTLKLDDKDFAATNAGVWCHNLHDLQKRRVFTDWSKYTKDEVLK